MSFGASKTSRPSWKQPRVAPRPVRRPDGRAPRPGAWLDRHNWAAAGLMGAALAAVVSAGCGSGSRAAWPSRPITMIVAFDAGGGTDANARVVASFLERELGQPVNVVNRTGGSGVVGHTAIAEAAPDGYTLGYIVSEVAMMHWAGLTDLTYEAFTPLAMMTGTAGSLLVRHDAPYATARDLLEAIEARPGELSASGSGQGGIWHVTLAGVLESVGLDPAAVRWVPHQGAAPALTDLSAGGLDLVVAAMAEARAMIDAGRVRALAVADADRHPLFPEVPTLSEAVGSDWTVVAWGGVAGPAGLPEALAIEIGQVLRRVYDTASFREMLERRGTGVMFRDAPGFRRYMAESDARFGRIMQAMGMTR